MATPLAIFPKGPGENLDYTIDGTEYLGADTILTVAWTFPAGINKTAEMFSATSMTVWVSGGTVGTNYALPVTFTTVAGRTVERSIQINVVSR